MIDRDQLREALEWWDREARFDPHFMLQGFDTFIEAARLVAEGREVWWCEEHESGFIKQHPDHVVCDAADAKHAYRYEKEPCRIVRMILIDGGNE